MTMNRWGTWVAVMGAVACLQGCASGQGEEASGVETAEGALERRNQESDAQIKAKLTDLLRDVVFMSEGDYPYTVFEADSGGARKLTSTVLRARLKAEIQTRAERDISKRTCRAEKLSLADVLADAALTDPDERDARQAGLAVKYMKEQLRGVVGYTFGTNASGDQDEDGPVVYVYVGISRTTGKLIAISTQAVYT